ncbi:MAG: cyclic peptide export ABC transporter [Nannocystaceae bacterium]|nr:cyclic peptide export ABC transporter [Myxococcales bacterium]
MKNVVDFFRRETGADLRQVMVFAVVAGLTNALVLALGVEAARQSEGSTGTLLALFGVCVLIYVYCARWTYRQLTIMSETALHNIKCRVAAKIERAEVSELERIGYNEIYDRASQATTEITSATGTLAHLLMSVAVLVGAMVYLLWISPVAFASIIGLLGGGMVLFWRRNATVASVLHKQAEVRVAFFDTLSDLLFGASEVKFSQARGRDLIDAIATNSDELRVVSIDAKRVFDDNGVFANVLLFLTVFLITFLLPKYLELPTEATIALITAVTYAWGPLGTLAGGMPVFIRLRVAIELVQKLEARLDAATARAAARGRRGPWSGQAIESIELEGVTFRYSDARHFSIGPVDLSLAPGEIVFLVGGNGSGKSTLFRVLTGLYAASEGCVRANGVRVDSENVAAYREYFSTILAEPHLFKKLYGMLDIDPAEVQAGLDRMGLGDKTEYEDGGFTSLELSTGQRKRIAMVVSLLEDRSICAFDEWAADQDPVFRRYFYRELLPALAAKGKIVIAVTHDDFYFDVADRIVTMDEGRVRSIETRERVMTEGADATREDVTVEG